MLLLLVTHAVVALAALPLMRRLGRSGFAVLAIAPAAAAVWALTQLGTVLDGTYPEETVRWVPGLGIELAFRLDSLTWLMTLIVGGVGALVLLYCTKYFSATAAHLGRFGAVFVAFAGAMLGLVTTDDVLMLYVFWELTTIFSYLLIGHSSDRKPSRRAAMQAIIVTTAGGLAMFVGLVILAHASGTTRISEIVANPPSGPAVTAAVVLLLVGALTKSALVPFHFWLPAAMAAPTPVSAYLHAAAMVKAGVYLVARFAPGFADLGVWRALVLVAGAWTLMHGGYRALRQYDLKLVLAFGTVSQLGLLIMLVGLGSEAAALAGLAMLGAHSMFKAALFLTVGIVDASTGTRDLRRLTGVGRAMPVTAVAGGLATLSMIGMWPFAGFVAKEAAIEALLADAGTTAGLALLVAMVIGSALTAGYGLRFWWGAFWDKSVRTTADREAPRPSADLAGPPGTPSGDAPATGHDRATGHAPAEMIGTGPDSTHAGQNDAVGVADDPLRINPVPLLLVAPALVLALLGLVLALVPGAGETLMQPHAATYPDREAGPGHLVLWAGFTPALGLSALILAIGAALFAGRAWVERAQARLTFPADADRAYRRSMRQLDDLASDVTALTQRGSLPMYLGTILVVMVVVELAAGYGASLPGLDEVRLWDRPAQVLVAGLAITSAVLAARSRRRLKAVILMGVSGYGVAALFVLHGAPDLGLTQVLVETITLVVFVLVLRRLPAYFSVRPLPASRWVRIAIGTAVGLTVAVVTLLAPSARIHERVSVDFPEEAYIWGGGLNIVNVTLVDIRAYDTMGELSVLLAAATGIASLIFLRTRSGRIYRSAEARGTGYVWGATSTKIEIAPLPTEPSARGRNRRWLGAGATLAPQRRSVMFEIITRLLFHSMVVVGIYLLFAGHNSPGGGFAAGLMVGTALVVRYLAGGRYELGDAAPFQPGLLLGLGMLLSAGFGLISILAGGSLLESTIHEFTLPVFGDIKLVTSLFFDIGVFLLVLGVVLDILRSLGAEIDRHVEEGAPDSPDIASADPEVTDAPTPEQAAATRQVGGER